MVLMDHKSTTNASLGDHKSNITGGSDGLIATELDLCRLHLHSVANRAAFWIEAAVAWLESWCPHTVPDNNAKNRFTFSRCFHVPDLCMR